ncbi:MAG TPA: hypothetical protein VJ801_02385 [Polyangia bacterium]|nr:hypothetical protein [Polyangia bacterium]
MRRTPALISSLAFLLWNASGCGGQICGAMGCASGANITLAVPGADWATTRTWRVQVCRNSTCFSFTPDQLPAAVPPAGTFFYLTGDPSFAPDVFPSVSVAVSTGLLHIQWVIVWNGSDNTIVNGDRYTVAVTDAGGNLIAAIDRAVNYTRVAPNGESCGPVCQQARIE